MYLYIITALSVVLHQAKRTVVKILTNHLKNGF